MTRFWNDVGLFRIIYDYLWLFMIIYKNCACETGQCQGTPKKSQAMPIIENEKNPLDVSSVPSQSRSAERRISHHIHGDMPDSGSDKSRWDHHQIDQRFSVVILLWKCWNVSEKTWNRISSSQVSQVSGQVHISHLGTPIFRQNQNHNLVIE